MKKKDISDLRSKTGDELEKLATDLGLQIDKARMDLATRKSKNTNIVANLKQKLAITLSIKREAGPYAKP